MQTKIDCDSLLQAKLHERVSYIIFLDLSLSAVHYVLKSFNTGSLGASKIRPEMVVLRQEVQPHGLVTGEFSGENSVNMF